MKSLNFRTVFWSGAALLIAAVLLLAVLPKTLSVDIGRVIEGPMTVSVRDEGYSRVREVYVVSAPVAGRLMRVDSEAGDFVTVGDVVANILPTAPAFLDARSHSEAEASERTAEAALGFARAGVERAVAQTAFAQAEEERIARLFESEIASQGALDRVRMELRTAQANEHTARASVRMRTAELEAARARLIDPDESEAFDLSHDVAAIRSPITGRILRVLQESESVVAPGSPILEMGNPADLEIVVELLSTDAVQVAQGGRVLIEDWGPQGDVLRGRVRRVEPSGFLKVSALGVEEQRVNVVIDLLDSPDVWSSLGHGFRVEASIVVWEEDAVIQTPVSSLFRAGESWAVFIVVDGRAQIRHIDIARTNGEQVQVLSGLTAGDEILLYPGDSVSEGARVKPRNEAG